MEMDSNRINLETSLGVEWKTVYVSGEPTEYGAAHRALSTMGRPAWAFLWHPDELSGILFWLF